MADTYKADAYYKVILARPVVRGSRKLLPRDKHRLAGHVLNEIIAADGADAIDTAEEIE